MPDQIEIFKDQIGLQKNLDLRAEIIRKFGISMAFAKAAGTTELIVSQIITGRKRLSDEEKKHWAEILSCPPQLIGFEELETDGGKING